MMFVAAAAMMLASCDKDNNNEDNGGGNGGNNGPSLSDNNIVALNNDIAAVESTVWMYEQDYTGYLVQAQCERCHFLVTLDMPLIGTTIDLSTALDAQGNYGFSYEGDLDGEYYEIRQGGGYGNVSHYDSQTGDQVASPLFASGTLTTVNNDEGFTLTINGTLLDGRTFVARIFVTKENIGYIGNDK